MCFTWPVTGNEMVWRLVLSRNCVPYGIAQTEFLGTSFYLFSKRPPPVDTAKQPAITALIDGTTCVKSVG